MATARRPQGTRKCGCPVFERSELPRHSVYGVERRFSLQQVSCAPRRCAPCTEKMSGREPPTQRHLVRAGDKGATRTAADAGDAGKRARVDLRPCHVQRRKLFGVPGARILRSSAGWRGGPSAGSRATPVQGSKAKRSMKAEPTWLRRSSNSGAKQHSGSPGPRAATSSSRR